MSETSADIEALTGVSPDGADPDVPVLRAYRRAVHRLRVAPPEQRAGILRAMALTEEPAALDALGRETDLGWSPLWSFGPRSAFHVPLVGHAGPVLAVAFGTVAGRPVLASGGADGSVRLWDPVYGQPIAALTGHTGDVVGLAFAAGTGDAGSTAATQPAATQPAATQPAGPRLASAGQDGTVRIWDAGRAVPGPTISVAGEEATGVVFLRIDERDVLATGSRANRGPGGAVDLWDPGTGEHLRRLYDDDVEAMCAVPVGGRTMLAASSQFGPDASAVRLWDPATGALEATWTWQPTRQDRHGLGSFVRTVVVSRDGRVMLGGVAAWDCSTHDDHDCTTLVWWDAATHEEVDRRNLSPDETVLASDGARRLAIGFSDGRRRPGVGKGPDVEVTGIDRRRIVDLQGHARRVRAVAFGAVGGSAVVATAGDDAIVLVWDAESEHLHYAAEGPHGSGLAVATGAPRPVLAAGSGVGYLQLHDPATGGDVGSLLCHAANASRGHACDDDGPDHCSGSVAGGTVAGRAVVASCGRHTNVVVWDPDSGRALRVLDCTASAVALGDVDGRALVATNGHERWPTAVWDAATGERVAELPDVDTGDWSARPLGFGTAAGRSVLATGTRRSVDLWDPLTGDHLLALPGPEDGPVALAAGDDVLAVAARDDVRVWESTTGYPLSTVAVPAVTCLAAVVVEGRSRLLTGAADGTVALWDPASGRQLTTLATFARPVTGVAAASIDGRPYAFAQCITGLVTAARLA